MAMYMESPLESDALTVKLTSVPWFVGVAPLEPLSVTAETTGAMFVMPRVVVVVEARAEGAHAETRVRNAADARSILSFMGLFLIFIVSTVPVFPSSWQMNCEYAKIPPSSCKASKGVFACFGFRLFRFECEISLRL
jgi:hypothetical protein